MLAFIVISFRDAISAADNACNLSELIVPVRTPPLLSSVNMAFSL